MLHQVGSVTVKAAYIMAAGAVIAAVIGSIFALFSWESTTDRSVSAKGNITVNGGVIQTGDGTIDIEGSLGSREKLEDDKP